MIFKLEENSTKKMSNNTQKFVIVTSNRIFQKKMVHLSLGILSIEFYPF